MKSDNREYNKFDLISFSTQPQSIANYMQFLLGYLQSLYLIESIQTKSSLVHQLNKMKNPDEFIYVLNNRQQNQIDQIRFEYKPRITHNYDFKLYMEVLYFQPEVHEQYKEIGLAFTDYFDSYILPS
jgi:hypothetical protein